jgi:hypothetical protein
MAIEKYVHRCTIQTGDMAGNDHVVEVDQYDVEYGNECTNCGEKLATVEQVVAHIYGELTG